MVINDSEAQLKDGVINLPDDKNIFIVVGANNSGKSTFLRSVLKTFGSDAYRVDVNRTILKGEGAQNKGYYESLSSYQNNLLSQSDDNTEKNFQVLQDYFGIKDKEREPIVEWYNKYFPNHIYEEREDPENTASPMFLKINGFSITKQGSGMRATLEIFVKLHDPKIKYLCIDEPELGLEPQLQKFLFQAIKDKASNEKKVFIATHSHHFLDIEEESNNYICQRDSQSKIFLTPVLDLKKVIFKLLGNTLSSYLLPEKIIILEGPSDGIYLNKVLSLAGKVEYTLHPSGSINNTSDAIKAITQFLRFNSSSLSVYKDSTHVIVDQPTHLADTLKREWERLLTNPGQICVLPENGIEFYYPERILREIFNTDESRNAIVNGYLETEEFNGVVKSKTELAKLVVEKLVTSDLEEENALFDYVRNLP